MQELLTADDLLARASSSMKLRVAAELKKQEAATMGPGPGHSLLGCSFRICSHGIDNLVATGLVLTSLSQRLNTSAPKL